MNQFCRVVFPAMMAILLSALIPAQTSNAITGSGPTDAAAVTGDQIRVVITTTTNIASISPDVKVGTRWYTVTVPPINPGDSVREVAVIVTLTEDVPAGTTVSITGTAVSAQSGGHTATVTATVQ